MWKPCGALIGRDVIVPVLVFYIKTSKFGTLRVLHPERVGGGSIAHTAPPTSLGRKTRNCIKIMKVFPFGHAQLVVLDFIQF